MKKRLLETLGMLLVGDGLLTVLDPERHCLLWEIGPEFCRDLIDAFARSPNLARCAGLAEVAVGVVLSQRQEPGVVKRLGLS